MLTDFSQIFLTEMLTNPNKEIARQNRFIKPSAKKIPGIHEIARIQRELNQAFQGQGARDVIKILLIHNQKKLAPAIEISKYCYGKEMFDEINQQDGSSDKHIKDILEKLR